MKGNKYLVMYNLLSILIIGVPGISEISPYWPFEVRSICSAIQKVLIFKNRESKNHDVSHYDFEGKQSNNINNNN